MKTIYRGLWTLLLLLVPTAAHAYVGPGAGLTAIGSIIAVVVVILLLLVGFLWYPIKRLRGRKRSEEEAARADEPLDESSDRSTGL